VQLLKLAAVTRCFNIGVSTKVSIQYSMIFWVENLLCRLLHLYFINIVQIQV